MSGGYDIDVRMAQIAGQPPRIEPLEEQDFDPAARQLVEDLNQAFGLGSAFQIPEVLRTMLRHVELFQTQLDMSIALVGKGSLPAREREIAILRNAWLMGAPYEWGEHVDIGKRCQLTTDDVARTAAGSADQGWSEHDAAICKGVEELRDDTMISDATWATLAKTWSDKQLIEFTVLVGQYTSTAYFQNSVRARLAPDNPGLSYR